MNKQRYLDLIELAVGAYTEEHIARYTADVKENGLREHGYPRLAANIGILLANGRGMHRLSYFPEMMSLCCSEIPVAKARAGGNVGNDFSVKEIVLCLTALEQAGTYPRCTTEQWRQQLATIDPYKTYSCIAPVPPKVVGNWAAFAAASEQTRAAAGLGNSDAFIHNQILSQLLVFDENGMYRDPHEPLVYDMVTRLQLALALERGYRGQGRDALEAHLHRSARPTLLMQSVSGEIPFGGRSNQFLHNETFYAALCEFYASWYHTLGDDALAGQFKSAARLAVNSLMPWLGGSETFHVKNRYPQDSMIGCEGYAYFDKYMVTMGSWAYLAYHFADGSIEERPCPAETGGYIWSTSTHFHKDFLCAGGYAVEIETDADFTYDANGIGRIHKAGAPGAICLSVPFPCAAVTYRLCAPNPTPLAIGGGVRGADGTWCFVSEKGTRLTQGEPYASAEQAALTYTCTLPNGCSFTQAVTVEQSGVTLTVSGEGEVAIELPIFVSDGQITSVRSISDNEISVLLDGWCCRYRSSEPLVLTTHADGAPVVYQNRNGLYHRAQLCGANCVRLHIEITPA